MIQIGIWIVGGLYSALVVGLSSNNAFNVFNEKNDLIQWSVSKEDYVLAILNLIILILACILVTGSYTATIVFLWRKSKGKGKILIVIINYLFCRNCWGTFYFD